MAIGRFITEVTQTNIQPGFDPISLFNSEFLTRNLKATETSTHYCNDFISAFLS